MHLIFFNTNSKFPHTNKSNRAAFIEESPISSLCSSLTICMKQYGANEYTKIID